MKLNVEFKGFEPIEDLHPQQALRKMVERLAQRLERTISGFPQDPVSLRLAVEHNQTYNRFHVSLTLDEPNRTLAAEEEMHEAEAAIRAAFSELERQLKDYTASLHGKRLWDGVEKRAEVRHERASVVPDHLPESFFELVSPHLESVREFVGRALAITQAQGELPEDTLEREEIVDATLVAAYKDYEKHGAPGDIQPWLIRLATKQLEHEIKQAKSDRDRRVHFLVDVEKSPQVDEEPTPEDEIEEYHHTDEDSLMEELIPAAAASTPELEAEQQALRGCIRRAFATLPLEWRRELLLRYDRRLNLKKIAKQMRQDEGAVQKMLKDGREFLRERLIESGCTPEAIETGESLQTTAEVALKERH